MNHRTDSLTGIFRAYSSFIHGMEPEGFLFVMRLCLVLVLAIFLSSLAFHRFRNRSHFIQTMMAVLGFLLGFSLPLDSYWLHGVARVWAYTLALAAIFFLPAILAYYLARTRRGQWKLRITIYSLILIGWILN